MTEPEAREFAAEWIEAWNEHNLERIVAHYSPTVEYSSPFVARLSGEPSGVLNGNKALRDHIQKGLAVYPDLHFELINVFNGVGSAVLYYRSVNNLLAAEFMGFDANGKIEKIVAHYSS